MLAEADKLNIEVSEKELQDALLSFSVFQKDGVFNMDQYKAVLSRESLTPESFERLQRISMREGKLRSVLMNTVNVSDLEARNWYQFLNTQTAVSYIGFDPKKYTDIHPDDNQIKQYYEEHKDQYKSEPKVKALYLNFAPEDHKDKVSITEDQVQDYYGQNPKEFQIPETVEAGHILIKVDEKATEEAATEAEKRALDIYDRIIKGEGFEALAKKYSEDSSKDNGGYLGRFEKQQMVKPFADQAFSMKAGDISKPVKTMFGWHIIKLISKENASTLALSQVSEKIRQTLEDQETQNEAYLKAGKAFDAVIDGDDLDQVAQISGKPVMETGEFPISGEGLDMPDHQEFAKIAFELTKDNISDVKQIGNSYYLIKLVQRIDSTVLDLDQAKDKIVQDLTENLRQAKAKEEARLYLEKAKEAQSLALIARDHRLELKTTPLFSRNGTIEDIGNSPEFIQAGFSVNENQKIFPEIIENPTGYYLIEFKEKKIPEDSEMTENMADLKQQILWRKQSQTFQDWITESKKRYTVEYDPQLLN